MPCVFCGRSGLTPEHVLAEWIGRIAPAKTADYQFRSSDLPPARRQPKLYAEQVKVVCQDNCNGGWMGRLEDGIKPTLTPLIQGRSRNLPPDAQALLAKWAAKTALMACYLRPKTFIPEGYPKQFYEGQVPPTVTMVWIARHEWTGQSESYGRRTMRVDFAASPFPTGLPVREVLPDNANGYAVTISVCYFAFKVLVFRTPPFNRPIRIEVDLDPGVPGVEPIWPTTKDGLRWPPPSSLDNLGLAAFRQAGFAISAQLL